MIAQKAKRLLEMREHGINVPPFAVFTLSQRQLMDADILSQAYDGKIAPMVQQTEYIIIRPCLPQEDGINASYAGILDSKVFPRSSLDKEGFIEAIRSVNRDILNNERIAAYSKKHNMDPVAPDYISYIVQAFIQGGSSGIMFTVNPATRRDEIIIEATLGLNSPVTDGIVSPDRYIVDKGDITCFKSALGSKKRIALIENGEVIVRQRDGGSNPYSLEREQVIELAAEGMRLEALYGMPQDIEWTYKDGRLYILQTRPVVL